MFESAVERLAERLRREPGDLEAWRELGRLVARTGKVPAFVEPYQHLPHLHALWALAPEDRTLHALVLGAAGLELVREPAGGPGLAWELTAADAGDHLYDPRSGLPLRVRLVDAPPGTGEFVLVSGGEVTVIDRSAWERGGAEKRVEVASFWAGRDLLEHGAGPRLGLSWDEAAELAAELGCRLPAEAEWVRAALGTGFDPAGLSPFGLRHPYGKYRQWSGDWGPPMVDRWLGRVGHDPEQGRGRVCLGRGFPEHLAGRAPRDWYYETLPPGMGRPDLGVRLVRDLIPGIRIRGSD